MDQRVPVQVQPVLTEYISRFHEQLPDTLEGLYLHGSIALNAYLDGVSDIDFIAIVNRQIIETEIKILAKIHQSLAENDKAPGMDGCYLLWEDLGRKQIETKTCLYVNEGEIRWSRHEINPVTWWILKSKGIRVIGPEVTSFHFDVSEHDLAAYVRNNMNTYWLNRIRTLRKFKRLTFLMPNRFSDQELQWCITGMLRQFYTLREYEIISKVDAGYYAIDAMPERWHNIIEKRSGFGKVQTYVTTILRNSELMMLCIVWSILLIVATSCRIIQAGSNMELVFFFRTLLD